MFLLLLLLFRQIHAQISLVVDLNVGTADSIFYQPGSYPSLNDFTVDGSSGRLFFVCKPSDSVGYELCTSDGTGQGTKVVKNINGAPGASAFKNLDEARRIVHLGGGKMVFKAFADGTGKDSLWISDGCASRTKLVSSVNSAFAPGIRALHASGQLPGLAFFFASGNGFQDDELWRTDGETAALAVDACPAFSCPGALKSQTIGFLNGKVFFEAAAVAPSGFDQPKQLWVYDPGTGAGAQFAVLNAGGAADIAGFASAAPGLFFVARNHLMLLRDANVGTAPVRLGPTVDFVVPPLVPSQSGSKVFFQADSAGSGNELHWADGTTAALAKDLVVGSVHGWAEEIVDMGQYVMFVGDKELYRSDGTPAGTVLVKDLGGVGSTASYPRHLTRVGQKLYFSGEELATGRELWVSDGTEAGTMIVQDLCPGPCSSNPAHLTAAGLAGDVLLFSASLAATGRELYRVGGVAGQPLAPALVCEGGGGSSPTPAQPTPPPAAPSLSGGGSTTLAPTVAVQPTPTSPTQCSSVFVSSCATVCGGAALVARCECNALGISDVQCSAVPSPDDGTTVTIPPGGVTGLLPDGTFVAVSPDGGVTIGGQPASTTVRDAAAGTITATDGTGRVVVITPGTGQVAEASPPPSSGCTGPQTNQCIAACAPAVTQFCDCSSGSPSHICQPLLSVPPPPPLPPTPSGAFTAAACTAQSTELCESGCAGVPGGVYQCLCSPSDGQIRTLQCAAASLTSGGQQLFFIPVASSLSCFLLNFIY